MLTLLIALLTGTFRQPGAGWAAVIGNYLFTTIVFGAALANIWEELAWTGLVQRRLMRRRGLLAGSLLAAGPFALIHLPLAFADQGFTGRPLQDVLVNRAVLFLVAPAFRCLAGITYPGTGGSVLIVALLHASFNASGAAKLGVFEGEWQQIAAIIVLLAALAAGPASAYPAHRPRTWQRWEVMTAAACSDLPSSTMATHLGHVRGIRAGQSEPARS